MDVCEAIRCLAGGMFALVSETYSVVSRLSPGTAGMIKLLQLLLLVLNVVQVGSGMLPYRM